MGTVNVNRADLRFIGELLEDGKVEPVIDRDYALGEVAEDIRYREEGHARGKVVITVGRRRSYLKVVGQSQWYSEHLTAVEQNVAGFRLYM